MSALLESDDAPAIFMKRSKEMEAEKTKAQAETAVAENKLASVAPTT